MILSYDHDFIFLKVPKTAGSSVEVVLADLAGPDAIVTPLEPPEPGHQPRNYHRFHVPARELLHAAFVRPSRRPIGTSHSRAAATKYVLSRTLHQEAFWSHMGGAEVRRRVGRARWDASFTFCFVRNPWDQAVSQYFWYRSLHPDAGDFDSFVLGRPGMRSGWDIYAGRDGVEVDFVGRYEHLERDLAHVLATVGIDREFRLPRSKGGHRDPAGVVWTRAASERIRMACRREIEEFGYEEPDWVTAAIAG